VFVLTRSSTGSLLSLYQGFKDRDVSPTLISSYSTSYFADVGGRYDPLTGNYIFGTYPPSSTFDEEENNAQNRIVGVDALTGEEKFMFPPSSSTIGLERGVYSPPALSMEHPIAYFRVAGYVMALNTSSGNQLWNVSLVGEGCGLPSSLFSSSQVFGGGVAMLNEKIMFVNHANCIFKIEIDSSSSSYPSNPIITKTRKITSTDSPLITTPTIAHDQTIFVGYSSSLMKLSSSKLNKRWITTTKDDTSFLSVEHSPVAMGKSWVVQVVGGSYFFVDQSDGEVVFKQTISSSSSLFPPSLDLVGRMFFSVSHIVQVIGSTKGGCDAGLEWNMNSTSSFISSSLPNSFCSTCGRGTFKPDISSQDECQDCPKGSWNKNSYSTFCYPCADKQWCPGRDECLCLFSILFF